MRSIGTDGLGVVVGDMRRDSDTGAAAAGGAGRATELVLTPAAAGDDAREGSMALVEGLMVGTGRRNAGDEAVTTAAVDATGVLTTTGAGTGSGWATGVGSEGAGTGVGSAVGGVAGARGAGTAGTLRRSSGKEKVTVLDPAGRTVAALIGTGAGDVRIDASGAAAWTEARGGGEEPLDCSHGTDGTEATVGRMGEGKAVGTEGCGDTGRGTGGAAAGDHNVLDAAATGTEGGGVTTMPGDGAKDEGPGKPVTDSADGASCGASGARATRGRGTVKAGEDEGVGTTAAAAGTVAAGGGDTVGIATGTVGGGEKRGAANTGLGVAAATCGTGAATGMGRGMAGAV